MKRPIVKMQLYCHQDLILSHQFHPKASNSEKDRNRFDSE